MAVVGGKTIREFEEYHRKTTLRIIATTQAVVAVAVSVVLGITGALSWTNPLLWILPISVALIGTGVGIIFSSKITDPLYEILTALAHKKGEPNANPLPNPNSKQNEETGLKSVLQTLYEASQPSEAPAKDAHQSFLTEALNHTSCGVVILGPDGSIVSANAATPISHDQEGKPFLALSFLNEESITEWVASIKDTSINAERRWQRVGTDHRYTKKQRFFDVVASYEKGSAAETVIFLFDQSERYLPEEEDLNFIAFAAHELRGPITIIKGYLDILEHELADRMKGDEPELLRRLSISANRLSSYINNILNVAKFDRHHLQVHLYEDTVQNIYASIADDMQLRAKAQHRLLNVYIPADLPTVAADRGSISEVISNLIDNAIKYSFEGGLVEVRAELKGEFVEVSVIDNGIGMPVNVVNNLFRKFYRSHRSREAVAGVGIGLYICKAFVESHGGSISVNSRENEGSTFSFTLPIYATVADKLLEDGQLNQSLVRRGGGWIKNHSMYRR